MTLGAGSSPAPQGIPSKRIVSIDALRGFDMFWIVGGAATFQELFRWTGDPTLRTLSRQFRHSRWHGFTFYDLIFPLFIFVMGVSIPLALGRRLEKGDAKKTILSHIAQRGFLLILFGLIYNGLLQFDFSDFYYSGVLQRIGICYLFAATIALYAGWRAQAGILIGLLLGYWALMALVPVPEFGAGDFSRQGNLSAYLDRLYLPGSLGYRYGDNEGILSTLPAIGTALLGVLTGHWMRSSRPEVRKSQGLLATGVACLAVAWVWNLAFPINKLLWSSSYVLWAGGWSLLLLAFFHFTIDVLGYRRWAFFFIVIGMNAITIYMAQEIIPFDEIAEFFLGGAAGLVGSFDETLLEIGATGLKWGFVYFLFKHGIFLKV